MDSGLGWRNFEQFPKFGFGRGNQGIATGGINGTHPANIGDDLIIYAIGLGDTNPAVATGAPAPPFPGLAPLRELADFAGLHLKVTSHVLEEAGEHAPALVSDLAASFGAERLVWGSDYSQTHDRSYAELVALGRDACAGLSAPDQARVLGENALRLWPALA